MNSRADRAGHWIHTDFLDQGEGGRDYPLPRHGSVRHSGGDYLRTVQRSDLPGAFADLPSWVHDFRAGRASLPAVESRAGFDLIPATSSSCFRCSSSSGQESAIASMRCSAPIINSNSAATLLECPPPRLSVAQVITGRNRHCGKTCSSSPIRAAWARKPSGMRPMPRPELTDDERILRSVLRSIPPDGGKVSSLPSSWISNQSVALPRLDTARTVRCSSNSSGEPGRPN